MPGLYNIANDSTLRATKTETRDVRKKPILTNAHSSFSKFLQRILYNDGTTHKQNSFYTTIEEALNDFEYLQQAPCRRRALIAGCQELIPEVLTPNVCDVRSQGQGRGVLTVTHPAAAASTSTSSTTTRL